MDKLLVAATCSKTLQSAGLSLHRPFIHSFIDTHQLQASFLVSGRDDGARKHPSCQSVCVFLHLKPARKPISGV